MTCKKNKIWIVSEIYYPVLTSTGYLITEIAEYLAKKSCDVNVICTGSSYNESNNFKFIKREVINHVHIHRINTGNLSKNNAILRVIRLLWSSIRIFIKILKSIENGDELIVVTNPAFLLILLPIIAKLKSVQYKIIVHDVFPENLVAIGKIKKDTVLLKIVNSLFNWAYSNSQTCIVIGRDMMQIIKAKVSNNTQLIYIPNWADVDKIFPTSKIETTTIRQLNLTEKFVYQFAGNIGHAQGIENLLDAIKILKNNKLHFLFIGTGAKEKIISEYISRYSLTNVTTIGFQNRSDQNDFLNACDVALITLKEGMLGLGVPSKTYNIMAAGKPIIYVGDEHSEIGLCIKENNIGWVVEPNNPKALAAILIQGSNNPRLLDEMKIRTRKVAEDHYAKEIILSKYFDLFK